MYSDIPIRKPTKITKNPNRHSMRAFIVVMVLMLFFSVFYNLFHSRLHADRLPTPDEGQIFVHFIDIGQGDSILIQSMDHAVLIDGGEFSERTRLLSHLRRAGVTRLDLVVATHPHSDHIGGLVAVLNQLYVGHILMPNIVHTTETFENFLAAIENNNIPVTFSEAGHRIQAGIIELNVLGPLHFYHSNLNNSSIVLRLVYENTSFLFTGDMEEIAELELVNSGVNLRSNVLKVAHHGSNTSTSDIFLSAVMPDIAVISAGRNNQFGHPHRDTISALEALEIPIFRTDLHGTIVLSTNGIQIYLTYISY